jgi:hypothetical protein
MDRSHGTKGLRGKALRHARKPGVAGAMRILRQKANGTRLDLSLIAPDCPEVQDRRVGYL